MSFVGPVQKGSDMSVLVNPKLFSPRFFCLTHSDTEAKTHHFLCVFSLCYALRLRQPHSASNGKKAVSQFQKKKKKLDTLFLKTQTNLTLTQLPLANFVFSTTFRDFYHGMSLQK